MKKLLLMTALFLFAVNVNAQDKLYLVFEFMKVDNEQESDYWEVESFWEKIHEQRVKNGDIIGWDLWQLKPGGEDQHFQYMTVNLYDDPVKMMTGAGDFEAALKAAYPDMSDEDLDKMMTKSAKSRDLAVRIYLEQIDGTNDDFDMPLGTMASINLMKVVTGGAATYEKMESEIFKPMHQKAVDNGILSSWGLLRFMSPFGSDTYASHITVDMYKDFNHYFNPPETMSNPEYTEDEIKKINEGIASRDMKYGYLATLVKTQKRQ